MSESSEKADGGESQEEVLSGAIVRRDVSKFMTAIWGTAAVVWVLILAMSGWDIPLWVISMSALGLAVLILPSAARWWHHSRTVNKLIANAV